MRNDKYLDEKIIEMINQVEKPEPEEPKVTEKKLEERTIYSGIKISGQMIAFERRPFAEDKITMMVPKEFTVMDPNKAKIKYPSEQRPGTILTDYTGTINIMFNYIEDKMTNDEAEMVRDRLLRIMRRVNPGIKPQTTEAEVISGKNVAYVEFSNPAMDGKLYNLMFFLEVDGRILMGSFNCRTKEMKYWKQPAFEMMCSIQVQDQKDDREECKEDEGNF